MTPLLLSCEQLDVLLNTLAEVALQMDDDGRRGAFDKSPLRPIYNKVALALVAAKRAEGKLPAI